MVNTFDTLETTSEGEAQVAVLTKAFYGLRDLIVSMTPLEDHDSLIACAKLREAFWYASTSVTNCNKVSIPCCKPNGACDSLGTPCAA